MSWVFVAVAGVSAVGAGVAANEQANAAEDAASIARGSQGATNRLSQTQYEQNRSDYLPYAQAGEGAINLLSRSMGINPQSVANQRPLSYGDWAAKNVAYDPAFEQAKGSAKGSSARWAQGEQARRDAENRNRYQEYVTNFTPEAAPSGTASNQPDLTAFTTSPGYQFRLNEGTKAGQNAFAARGGAFSGNALKALAEYNQNMASNEFGNWWNQLSGLAGIGQNAVAGTSSSGWNNVGTQANANSNYASQAGNAALAKGDARSSGVMGVTNSLGFGASNYLGGWGRNPNGSDAALNNYTPFYQTVRG